LVLAHATFHQETTLKADRTTTNLSPVVKVESVEGLFQVEARRR